MSILIKGMDKPTDCGVCPFEDFGYCSVKGERNTSEVGIDVDCPLIEIAEQTEPQTIRCPKCGRNDYIREFGKDFSVTAEEAGFKYKCINCNTYIEPQSDRKTEPQTCEECEHWNDTEDGCADRHGCKTEPQTEAPYIDIETGILHWCGWKYRRIYEDEPQTEREEE